jgi:glyoxylate reductase
VSRRVLVTREIPTAGLRLLEDFDLTILSERPPERGELLEAAKGASGILATLTEQVDAELMQAAGEDLKVIANMAVGYDNVDLEAARERGVVITNTPEVLDETTADTAFMLLLAAARRLGEGERIVRSGRWEAWGPKMLIGPDVWGKTLGIVGFGRIGQAMARRARGFDMEVFYTARSRKEDAKNELGARYAELDELLQTSDFVLPAYPAYGGDQAPHRGWGTEEDETRVCARQYLARAHRRRGCSGRCARARAYLCCRARRV